MNVTRKEQRIIQRALNAWQASGELTPSDSQRLAPYPAWDSRNLSLIYSPVLLKLPVLRPQHR